ncbi:MAG: spore coat associated protein CotJA [Clostridia bacterium]|nr:spore coat associated protein CotJA [Clostridia bacterium]
MTIPAPSLAMVYSPKQVWGETYEVDVALERGTLFPELDKPFLGYLKEDIRGR